MQNLSTLTRHDASSYSKDRRILGGVTNLSSSHNALILPTYSHNFSSHKEIKILTTLIKAYCCIRGKVRDPTLEFKGVHVT